jgi:hypothetical protein
MSILSSLKFQIFWDLTINQEVQLMTQGFSLWGFILCLVLREARMATEELEAFMIAAIRYKTLYNVLIFRV